MHSGYVRQPRAMMQPVKQFLQRVWRAASDNIDTAVRQIARIS